MGPHLDAAILAAVVTRKDKLMGNAEGQGHYLEDWPEVYAAARE